MARALRITALSLLAALALASPASADEFDSLLAPESVCPGQTDASLPNRAQVATMVCMHRYARRAADRREVHRIKSLSRSARLKARDIRRCQSFSHSACGRDAFYWFDRVGFLKGNYGVAENLSFGSDQAGNVRTMMSAWLDSNGHRRALLGPRYRGVGIGMVQGSYKGFDNVQFWVAHFGYHE